LCGFFLSPEATCNNYKHSSCSVCRLSYGLRLSLFSVNDLKELHSQFQLNLVRRIFREWGFRFVQIIIGKSHFIGGLN